ncbi:MAG: response regulator [Moraxellaceae bacterium]|nr:response regulator [Moraxellaceae bacterium]MDP1775922.1 response regulator [Moraxellaceae bacterium]
MSKIAQRRIRRRIMFLITIPALVLSLLVLALSASARWQSEQALEVKTIQLLVNQFAASADYALQSNQPALLSASVERLLALPSVQRVQVYTATGELWLQQQKPDALVKNSNRMAANIETMSAQLKGDDWLSNWPDTTILLGVVSVDRAPHQFSNEQATTLRQALSFAFVATVILLLIGAAQAKRLLSYIDRIRLHQREAFHARQTQWQDDQLRQAAWGKWSHDVRTPLHGVAGMLELLETTHLDAEQRDYVRQARSATRAMEASLQQSPLPAIKSEDYPDEAALQQAQLTWRQRQILLVEDDAISQRLVEGLLTEWGANVQCVNNGAEGLACVNQPWDLILLDGELPDMTAITFAAQWTTLHQQNTPMVVITAHSQPEKISAYEQAGLGPVLQKPLRRRHLLAVLTPLFNR